MSTGERVAYEIYLTGDIDASRENELSTMASEFAHSGIADAVIDLEQVTAMDTTGLKFLSTMYGIAQARRGSVEVVRPQTSVHWAIDQCGLGEVLDVTGQLGVIG